MLRGAEVTLVHGHMDVQPPMFLKAVPVTSAQDMFETVSALAPQQDMIIKAAAVADYTPVTVADGKIKKSDSDMSIPLKRTQDILAWLGQHRKENQVICGFSMETDHVLENSRAKLAKKNCQMICANSLRQEGAGFGTDTNILTLITHEKEEVLEKMTKEQAAHQILTRLCQL
jgi:phosphopantothenoylcysteine decarboxylase/phosphopantothenate--cysteine ligase